MCRPPRRAPEICSACGKMTQAEGRETCSHCGEPLPEPPKVPCKFTKKLCQIPCARSNETPEDGKPGECPWGNALDESADMELD